MLLLVNSTLVFILPWYLELNWYFISCKCAQNALSFLIIAITFYNATWVQNFNVYILYYSLNLLKNIRVNQGFFQSIFFCLSFILHCIERLVHLSYFIHVHLYNTVDTLKKFIHIIIHCGIIRIQSGSIFVGSRHPQIYILDGTHLELVD